MTQPSVPEIGRSMPQADAAAKVSGREKYISDWYGEDHLWAGVKQAGRVEEARLGGLPKSGCRKSYPAACGQYRYFPLKFET